MFLVPANKIRVRALQLLLSAGADAEVDARFTDIGVALRQGRNYH